MSHMVDDFQAWLIGILVAVMGSGGAIISWLMNRSINRLDDDINDHKTTLKTHSQLHQRCEIELANFKTEVAKDYAKDASVQQSLSRLHERIDEGFTEIRTDIKTILAKVK